VRGPRSAHSTVNLLTFPLERVKESNALTGSMPTEVGHLKKLQVFDIRKLLWTIPSAYG
jgi:hypothetical protein